MERILAQGGKVLRERVERGDTRKERCWLSDTQGHSINLSRSIGDLHFWQWGLEWWPEVHDYLLDESDRALVLGTDGFWDAFESTEVPELLIPFIESRRLDQGCEFLEQQCLERWEKITEGKYRDDLTFMVVDLNPLFSQRK